ncbi:MAG: tetratricopeptide repeat protein [Myxococcota bacterium]|nr:tetratricopeptide repeat protein [Myxococcota bacterium]
MFRFRLVLVFVSLAGVVACGDDASRLEEHMARGDAYYEEEKFSEAIIEYRSAQQIDPNYPDAHYNLARAYFQTDKPRDGFWELRETVRLDPGNREALIEFSQLQVLANEAEEALANMDRFLAEEGDVRGHVVRGQALDMLDRFEEANEAYENALKADPEHEVAMRALARSEMRVGQKEEARAVWEKLVEVHPTFANYTLLARAATQLVDDPEEAFALREQSALRALEVAEGDDRPGAYEQAASFYVIADRTPEAFALLEKGVEVEEDPVDVMYILARLHQGEGNAAEADAILEKASLARPDDPSAHRVLAAFRARAGDFERALESIERAVAIDPSDDQVKIQKAEILMELGFRQDRAGGAEEAREILVEVLDREPSNLFALVAHAKYRLGKNDPDEAVTELRRALEVRPDWAEASYLLGIALVAQEDYANGRVELARALELDPNLLAAKAALAEVHFKLGEWQYAVERARDYLAARPDDQKARLLLAQSLVSAGYVEAAAAELGTIPPEDRTGEVLFALGRVGHARSEFKKARSFYEAANEKLPGNAEIIQSLMSLDRREDRMDESKARVDAALEADPESAQLYQLRGVLAFNEGRNEDAERDFRKAIEMAPADQAGYQRLARFYAVTGRLEETTQIYEAAIEAQPEAAQFHHFLGVLYELSGDPDRAIERYESAIR